MTQRPTLRRIVSALLLTTVVLGGAAGCKSSKNTAVGAGEDVDICTGIDIYNGLSEPNQTDKKAVVAYLESVDRVLGRIKDDKKYKSVKSNAEQKPPATILGTLETIRGSYDFLRKGVADTQTPEQLKGALSAFSSSTPAFEAADSALEIWVSGECK